MFRARNVECHAKGWTGCWGDPAAEQPHFQTKRSCQKRGQSVSRPKNYRSSKRHLPPGGLDTCSLGECRGKGKSNEGTPRKRGPTWGNGVWKGQQAARDYGMDSKAFSSLACRSIQTAPRLSGETQPGWSKHRLGWARWLELINEPDVKASRTATYGASRSSCWC